MIYKETEPVNDEFKSQEVPDDEIQENVLRGEKLIDRSKKAISNNYLGRFVHFRDWDSNTQLRFQFF